MNKSSMIEEYIDRRVEGFHSSIASDIKRLRKSKKSIDITLSSGLYRLVYEPNDNWELVTLYDYEGAMFKLYHGLKYEIKNESSTVYFFSGNGHEEIMTELLKKSLKTY